MRLSKQFELFVIGLRLPLELSRLVAPGQVE